jgi:hypothetical protein
MAKFAFEVGYIMFPSKVQLEHFCDISLFIEPTVFRIINCM